jgi:transposase
MDRLGREVKAALEDGVRGDFAPTRGTCAELLRVEESLWTFARVRGAPPEDNAAERAERHAVIWRRISGGTDSAEGSRFVERMLTVVATCRQQDRDVPDCLECFEAARSTDPLPLAGDSAEDRRSPIPNPSHPMGDPSSIEYFRSCGSHPRRPP